MTKREPYIYRCEKHNYKIAQNALGLIEAIKDLKAQVTSLTKERDRLKSKLETRLSFVAVMENKNKIIEDLKSQLSNRDKEIEKLKAENKSLKGALNVTPGVVTEEDMEWARKKPLDIYWKHYKRNSTNSKGEA